MDTILLVEDALDLADVIDRELTAEGYRVVRAADGITALRLHASEQPGLVLLDWMLPEMDGLEVLRRLRADPRTRLLPVVILTSSKEEQDLIAGYKSQVNSYIRKPVDFDQFVETIRELGLYWLGLNEEPPR
jgi:DNA-binding response OmpR family regulator